MKLRKIQTITLVLLLSACSNKSGLEESIIIYDTEKREIFISTLDETDVKYRVQSDGQIFYPVENKSTVVELFEKVMGKKITELQPPR